jgi:hypothetical protein
MLFKLYIYLIDYQPMWVFLIFGWGAEKGCRIVRIVTGRIFWWLKKWWVYGKSCIFAGV